MKTPTVVVLAALLFGCTVLQTGTEPAKGPNQRIIYRDLTKPKAILYPAPKDGIPEKGISAAKHDAIVYFIEFENDSYLNFDEVQLDPLIAGTPSTANVLVMGHSHGRSAVGTMPLASKRADTIQGYLEGTGFVNVHTMAFWGDQTVSFAPSRGVQVYVLPEGADQGKTLPVVFATQTRKGANEDREGGRAVSCGTAAADPVKVGPGNV